MLKNKKILITGIANKFSIANGIAQSMRKNGAELAFAYQNERLLKKIKPIADDLELNVGFLTGMLIGINPMNAHQLKVLIKVFLRKISSLKVK